MKTNNETERSETLQQLKEKYLELAAELDSKQNRGYFNALGAWFDGAASLRGAGASIRLFPNFPSYTPSEKYDRFLMKVLKRNGKIAEAMERAFKTAFSKAMKRALEGERQ